MSENRNGYEQTRTDLTRSDIKRVSETILLQAIPTTTRHKKVPIINTNMRNLIILLSVVAVIMLALVLQMISSN